MEGSEHTLLKDKTAKGLLWGSLGNGIQQVLNLFFGIFLARLLSPSDYGMVGMLAIFTAAVGVLHEGGFSAALINRDVIDRRQYSSFFWCSITVSFILYLILFFCAPLIARFFHEPALKDLSRYVFLGVFISSFGLAPAAILKKELKVKQKTIGAVVALIVSGTVGLIMAMNGMSYWGIATQSIVYTLVCTAFNWYFARWKPLWVFDFAFIKSIASFSLKLVVTGLVSIVNTNIFSVLLGRFFTKVEVGFYNQAQKWTTMGISLLYQSVLNVSQPVLVEASEEQRQTRVLRKLIRFIAFVSFPAMFGLALISPELIETAITAKWSASADLMRILCVAGAFVPIQAIFSSTVLAKEQSDTYMYVNIAHGVIQIAVLLLTIRYGVKVMVICYAAVNVIWTFVWYYFTGKSLRYRLIDFLKDSMPFMLIALAVMAVAYVLTRGMTSGVLMMLARIALAVGLYALSMRLCGAKIYRESIGYLQQLLKKTTP